MQLKPIAKSTTFDMKDVRGGEKPKRAAPKKTMKSIYKNKKQ